MPLRTSRAPYYSDSAINIDIIIIFIFRQLSGPYIVSMKKTLISIPPEKLNNHNFVGCNLGAKYLEKYLRSLNKLQTVDKYLGRLTIALLNQ